MAEHCFWLQENRWRRAVEQFSGSHSVRVLAWPLREDACREAVPAYRIVWW